MKNKILLMAIGMALSGIPVASEASTNPFVPNGSVTINSMPQSENPIWTPPLASPSVTSSGILSAFYTSNMSQANPNSPQPSVAPCPAGYSGSNGTYQWSGSDNTGWVLTGDTGCVAPPPPPVVAAYVAPPVATAYVAPAVTYVPPATTYVAPASTTTTAVPATTATPAVTTPPSGPAFGGFAGTSPNGIGYGVGGNTTVTPSTPTLYPAATTPIYYNVISGGSGGGVGAGSGGSVQWNQSQNIQQKTVPSNFSWTNLWSSFSNFW